MAGVGAGDPAGAEQDGGVHAPQRGIPSLLPPHQGAPGRDAERASVRVLGDVHLREVQRVLPAPEQTEGALRVRPILPGAGTHADRGDGPAARALPAGSEQPEEAALRPAGLPAVRVRRGLRGLQETGTGRGGGAAAAHEQLLRGDHLHAASSLPAAEVRATPGEPLTPLMPLRHTIHTR